MQITRCIAYYGLSAAKSEGQCATTPNALTPVYPTTRYEQVPSPEWLSPLVMRLSFVLRHLPLPLLGEHEVRFHDKNMTARDSLDAPCSHEVGPGLRCTDGCS